MVQYPGAYRYSSYSCNALGRHDPLVTDHPTYLLLTDTKQRRLTAYRELFGDELTAELLTPIRETTNVCQILGNDRFKDEIEAGV